ncbi:hypothetical protein JCM5296_005448, partial [Sporobolomyces johnsonii]
MFSNSNQLPLYPNSPSYLPLLAQTTHTPSTNSFALPDELQEFEGPEHSAPPIGTTSVTPAGPTYETAPAGPSGDALAFYRDYPLQGQQLGALQAENDLLREVRNDLKEQLKDVKEQLKEVREQLKEVRGARDLYKSQVDK